ncbi:hypothetical protein [Desulfosporosinus sp. Sb-LF]|uniref:hypothetical protein n=1 Tax=Desulfosporosinus sp. Sb-LF TaxID=2560027 RepID=UPI00107F6732|nr:hypothetical protein [Desulfosporosinus sp. Sb-LF]TGE33167.1 hypothetical protein E4K68_06545 [Desulfosporosinus sp. Sb-LF]
MATSIIPLDWGTSLIDANRIKSDFSEDPYYFDALVEKIEILTPAHFIFELKSGRGEERVELHEILTEC